MNYQDFTLHFGSLYEFGQTKAHKNKGCICIDEERSCSDFFNIKCTKFIDVTSCICVQIDRENLIKMKEQIELALFQEKN